MSAPAKLAGFAATLAVVFGAGFGIGTAAGPPGGEDTTAPVTDRHPMPQQDMQQDMRSETSR